jgi:hypothetical protein
MENLRQHRIHAVVQIPAVRNTQARYNTSDVSGFLQLEKVALSRRVCKYMYHPSEHILFEPAMDVPA